MTEPQLHLGPHVVVPDLAGWRGEHLPAMPETAWAETPPDWVCEILSPSTEAIDRCHKLKIYATYKTSHCWLLNPATRFLESNELRDSQWLLQATFDENEDIAAAPFAAVPFPLAALWPLDKTPPNSA